MFEPILHYISPEQTGRMNRDVDYRTDYYSLGIVLYEMLCHSVPFKSDDKLDLIYCHIAKSPIEPYKVNLKVTNCFCPWVLRENFMIYIIKFIIILFILLNNN